ncbi:MAG: hypothetical protein HC918_05460 [Oscillatoriales cyanobacterium SM2_1_8]|nr:hypothetical protein [Oscillatoriales cyanobacterium SM2_1_8]
MKHFWIGAIALPCWATAGLAQPKTQVRLFENATVGTQPPAPIVLRGISGGPAETQAIAGRPETETGPCLGFVDPEPDHRITLQIPFERLRLQVAATGDTVLVVRGPGGVWCNDDADDRNPAIGGSWLAGTYEIWVGSYEAGAAFPYLLEIIP